MLSQAIQPVRFCALALWLLSTKAPLAAADRVLKVPFDYASVHGSILIHASVNDRQVVLILDTGSTYTVLRPESLGESRPDLLPTRPGPSRAGFIGDAVGEEVTLELGGRKFEKYRVAVMDLREILSHYREKIDGVLGLDFLLQFSEITINRKDKTITFVESDPSDVRATPRPGIQRPVRLAAPYSEPVPICSQQTQSTFQNRSRQRTWVRRKAPCL